MTRETDGTISIGWRGKEPHHFAWFDVLRCVAVLLVMTAHCPSAAFPRTGHSFFLYISNLGWVGVDLFFVLSGFLVSGLLFSEHQRTQRIDGRRFLIRRAFKIVPALYLMIAVTLVVDWLTGKDFQFAKLLHEVFFLQSYRIGYWTHTWTLGVEVQFYLLLLGLFLFLTRRGRASPFSPLPTIILLIFVACLAARLQYSEAHPILRFNRLCTHTHLRVDSLAAGVLLRYLYEYFPGFLQAFRRHRVVLGCAAVLLVLPSEALWSHPGPCFNALLPTLNYCGFALLLLVSLFVPFPAIKTGPHSVLGIADLLGKHSYSIYLWHLPVKQWLVDSWCSPTHPLAYLALYYLGALGVGLVLSLVMEVPMLRLRERLFPTRAV